MFVGLTALALQAVTPSAAAAALLRFESDDGTASAEIGGRIQVDGNLFDSDRPDDTSTLFLRRAYLGLSGQVDGWEYKLQHDLAADGDKQAAGLREAYLAHELAGGRVVLGQFTPYRGMEDLTSSARILLMERPFASASGIYSGAQYVIGLGFERHSETWGYGVSAYNLRTAAGPDTEGLGVAARAYAAPLRAPGRMFHIGVTSSLDNAQEDNTVVARVRPAGLKGESYVLAEGDSRTSYGLELAAQFGRLHAQSEFARTRFEPETGPDQAVRTGYIQAAYALSGVMRPYDEGVFKLPAAPGRFGAFELTARYDFIENADTEFDVSSTTLGLNWILSEHVLFMLNCSIGDAQGLDGDARVLAARAQMTF